MRPDLLTFLEAAYDFDLPFEAWQAQLVEAARRAFPETSGAYSYLYRIQDGAPVLTSPVAGDACFLEAIEEGHAQASPRAALRALSAPSHAAPTSLWLRDPATHRIPDWLGRMWSRFGVGDVLGLLATDRIGDSLALGLGLPRASYPDVEGPGGSALARQATLVARHVETAMAIRTALGDPEAVLADIDASGRGEWQVGSEPWEHFRECCRCIEDARDRLHAGDEQGLAVWDALVQGRYSIVRYRRGGGRLRFLVLQNPRNDRLRALSTLEREVVQRAARGQANKVIAIDLDLHPSSVANLLARALRKLGIKNRVQLALLARVLDARQTRR